MNAKTVTPQINTFCRIIATMLIETVRAKANAPKQTRAPRGNGRRHRE
jgi:hypothetical protein